MLGIIMGAKTKSIFPPGYKLKTGTLVSGSSSITMPTNIIPVAISAGYVFGSVRDAYVLLKDNLGKQLFYETEGYSGDGSATLYNTRIDLMGLYNYDFEILKGVKTITWTTSATAHKVPNISVVAWLEKSGGSIASYIKNGIACLKKVVLDMLGRVLGMGSKNFFPNGFKLKTGSLIKGGLGQTISIPDNVIPLSLKVMGHVIQEDRNNNAYGYVRDNAGKELLYFAGMGNERARDDAYANTTIDLMNLYAYSFDALKLVTAFNSTMTGTYNQTVLEITSWLEKVGG